MKENKNSAARIRANNKYNAKAYDRINIAVPKGMKQAVEVHAKGRGKTLNGLLNELIRTDMGLSEDEWSTRSDD